MVNGSNENEKNKESRKFLKELEHGKLPNMTVNSAKIFVKFRIRIFGLTVWYWLLTVRIRKFGLISSAIGNAYNVDICLLGDDIGRIQWAMKYVQG